MASRQLAQTQAQHDARAARAEDRLKGAELAQKYTGWTVWTTRDGASHVATRTGANARPPAGDDDVFALTIVADRWPELEAALVEQQAHDAELSSP